MRIALAGATGVIGRRLAPLLISAGHDVLGMTRSPARLAELEAAGVQGRVVDVYELDELTRVIVGFAPDLVMHQLTDLPDDPAAIEGFTEANARIRREGTRNLLTAARAAGSARFLAESVAWRLEGDAGRAVTEMERAVLHVGGVVLRYGRFHGPGTYHEQDLPERPRIHIDEAARRTALAIDERSGVIEIVDRATSASG